MRLKPDRVSARINTLPRWAQDFIHDMVTYRGAEAEIVEEVTFLRDQNKALIKLVGELKREIRRLERTTLRSFHQKR